MEHKNWNGFNGETWKNEINVRDFIQTNYKEYTGDDSFLAGEANWSDVVMAMTYSPIGFSVILKEDDIRAFDKNGIEISI